MSELIERPIEGLTLYTEACRALADAKAVDEVKHIRDKADAMRAAAHIAKNKDLEIDAAEIRIRAERRLGEMMAEQKANGDMNRGAADTGGPGRGNAGPMETRVSGRPITLSEAGIDKHLADRARKLAAVPEDEFEEELDDWRERVSQEGKRVTTRLEKRGEVEIAAREVPECVIPEGTIRGVREVCPTCGTVLYESREVGDGEA